jgi:plastocyanin
VRRHSALGSGLAALIALAAAPAASAQGPVIQAVDDLAGPNNRWEPSAVTVNVGGTVTWRYDGMLLAHNVKSTSANWDVDTPTSTQDGRPVTLSFSAEGTYDFVCKFHADTMKGTVTVGTPPPPPPPPLSEQPFPNDQQAPTVLDVADRSPPRLSRVRVAAVRNGARVRMRLSERARVRVRFKRAGIVIRTERRTLRKGVRSLTVRDPRMRGSYQVEVVARDLAGNRSRMKRLRVRVP